MGMHCYISELQTSVGLKKLKSEITAYRKGISMGLSPWRFEGYTAAYRRGNWPTIIILEHQFLEG